MSLAIILTTVSLTILLQGNYVVILDRVTSEEYTLCTLRVNSLFVQNYELIISYITITLYYITHYKLIMYIT